MMLYLEEPATRMGQLIIDDVRAIEWREARHIPEWHWLAVDFVEGAPGTVVSLVDLSG